MTTKERHNEELYGICEFFHNTYIRCKRLEWLGYVRRINGDVLRNILIGKVNKNQLFRKLKTKWKNTIEKDTILVDGIETLDWILDSEKWRGLLEIAQDRNESLRW